MSMASSYLPVRSSSPARRRRVGSSCAPCDAHAGRSFAHETLASVAINSARWISEGRITAIAEKPKEPQSNYAVTGVYMYGSEVFDIVRTLKPSGRGELEISDVNQHYVEQGRMSHSTLSGWWSDAGTFESLARANELVEGGVRN